MKINLRFVKRKTPSQDTSSKAIQQMKLSSFSQSSFGMWGIVESVYSEDVTVDVRMRNSIVIQRIPVSTREWVGYNDDRAFGERNLPPVGCKVFVVFPDGVDNPDTSFVLCSTVDLVWEIGEELKVELAVSGKERERLTITEAGMKFKENKDTGDLTLENSLTGEDKISIFVDNTNKKIEAAVGTKKLTLGTANKLEANGAVLEITNDGTINATPASGKIINLAGNTKTLVTHSALSTALSTFLTALNALFATKLNGGGSAGTLTLDISTSEATKAKTS